jgi:hypothetical protein
MFRSSLATHRAQAIQISTSPRTRRRAPSGTEANQNRAAIPAVAIAAPTSIPTLNDEHSDAKHCGTIASKAGHAGQQRLHPAQHGEPRQSRAEPDVHGTVGRPDLLRHVGRVGHDVPEGLLRLLAAARARTRTVSAFVPPRDTPSVCGTMTGPSSVSVVDGGARNRLLTSQPHPLTGEVALVAAEADVLRGHRCAQARIRRFPFGGFTAAIIVVVAGVAGARPRSKSASC